MERLRAFLVGIACGILQTALVYSVGFLYSATAPAYLSVLLAWLLGGALGCWLPPGLAPRWLFWLASLACWGNLWALWRGLPGTWLVAGISGGAAASYWLCHRPRVHLQKILFFESLGMAAGFSLSHGLIYALGLTWVVSVPALAILFTVKEGRSEKTASDGLQPG